MKTLEFNMSRNVSSAQEYIVKVYAWMSFALFITGIVSFWVVSSSALTQMIFDNNFIFIILIIIELIAVWALAAKASTLSPSSARIIFIFYAILNGITLSGVFLLYTEESLASTFFITAGTFLLMSIYGFVTKSDLSKIGNIMLMALVGLIIASLVNLFFQNATLYWITTFAGVIIFVVLIAFDTQKVKSLIDEYGNNSNVSIIGALTLYLDFINLFLYLLRIFGRRKRDW